MKVRLFFFKGQKSPKNRLPLLTKKGGYKQKAVFLNNKAVVIKNTVV